MSESEPGSALSFTEVAASEIKMSFSLNMLPWSIGFIIAGVLIGYFYGRMVQLQIELRSLSYLDGLTGIANRRHFQKILDYEWRHGIRTNTFLSLIMCDIDYFKTYNDLYGHQAGDECLKTVAGALSEAVERPRDLVARYGGEEFVVLLPETDAEGADKVAGAIRGNISSLCLPHEKSATDCEILTVSMGVATIIPGQDGDRVGEIISKADEALYKAKKAGRNEISVAAKNFLKSNDFDQSEHQCRLSPQMIYDK